MGVCDFFLPVCAEEREGGFVLALLLALGLHTVWLGLDSLIHHLVHPRLVVLWLGVAPRIARCFHILCPAQLLFLPPCRQRHGPQARRRRRRRRRPSPRLTRPSSYPPPTTINPCHPKK